MGKRNEREETSFKLTGVRTCSAGDRAVAFTTAHGRLRSDCSSLDRSLPRAAAVESNGEALLLHDLPRRSACSG